MGEVKRSSPGVGAMLSVGGMCLGPVHDVEWREASPVSRPDGEEAIITCPSGTTVVYLGARRLTLDVEASLAQAQVDLITAVEDPEGHRRAIAAQEAHLARFNRLPPRNRAERRALARAKGVR